MVQNIGKGTTPRKLWPNHPDYGKRGVILIHALADRLALPDRYRQLAALASRWSSAVHQASEISPETLLRLFDSADAFDSTVVMDGMLAACEADFRGRKGSETKAYPQAQIVRRAFAAAASVTYNDLRNEGYKPGKELDGFLRRRRIEAIKEKGDRFAYIQHHSPSEEISIQSAVG
jgi:tRNA nucleotidyltransferase (CCA-adding enzyme)